jgi:hypothetical protein
MVTHELSLTGSDREGSFGIYKNRGDSVSFVASSGENPPG